MTFIATVIARKGAAVIADSLVTSMHRTIEEQDFLKLLREKVKSSKGKDITLTPVEITKLFVLKPSHTKDYETKLFEYDKYTAITTSGAATINGKRIEELVAEKIEANNKNKRYSRKRILTKVKDFCNFLQKEIKTHIRKNGFFSDVRFIITHFDKKSGLTSVYRITAYTATKDTLKDKSNKIVEYRKTADFETVVCDGQNRISERVLFGDLVTLHSLIPKLVDKITGDLKINKKSIPKDYSENLRKSNSLMTAEMWDEVKMFRLKELSLQQAVDLACLLMNLEIDFQKYTQSIPTVGGVVKLAIIDKGGLKFISGDKVIMPSIM